ncbi:DUF4355 domain-containing protein [Bifidobacterium animalis]|uniref:DUF4355 domain-containing protein n=1 Tax=Bifidobacterium animalis TaxID=28025 RepID=UPI001C3EB228|nr:DUF4355 domain-containing protein [Bifidobacterium animalis]MCR1995724.1 DUF4355 domain-containing protein [Bifidobacterium animalis subsp. animalis]
MPKLHNLNVWQQTDPRRYLTVTGGNTDGGSSDHEPKEPPQQDPNGGSGKNDPDTSKEFSHALAKRVAEIEKKYEARLADYEQLKQKAAAYDEQQEAGKSDMDKLNERLKAIEEERDRLAAEKQRSQLVSNVSKETGVPVEVVSQLSAEDEESLKTAAESIRKLMDPQHGSRGATNVNRPNGRTPRDDRHGMDLLRDAYTN